MSFGHVDCHVGADGRMPAQAGWEGRPKIGSPDLTSRPMQQRFLDKDNVSSVGVGRSDIEEGMGDYIGFHDVLGDNREGGSGRGGGGKRRVQRRRDGMFHDVVLVKLRGELIQLFEQ